MVLIFTITTDPVPAEEVIRIGAILSVTGSGSYAGEAEKKAAILAQDMVNNRGGIFGKKLKLIIYDDETDVNTCLLAAEKMLTREGVVAVIGPTTSGNTLAISGMFQEAKVPLISFGQSEKVANPPKQWIFKIPPSESQAVTRLLNYVKSVSIGKIALISASDGTGRIGRSALREIAVLVGLQIVADEIFDPSSSSVSPLLEKILDTGAEAIVCWAGNSQTAMVARNRAELDVKLPLFAGPKAVTGRFLQLAGSAAEGVLLPTHRLTVFEQLSEGHPQKETIGNFIRMYENRYNSHASPSSGYAFDAIMLLIKAMERGGFFYSPGEIRNNLETIRSHVGVSAVYGYAPDNHGGTDWRSFDMVRVTKGKFKLVK